MTTYKKKLERLLCIAGWALVTACSFIVAMTAALAWTWLAS